MAESKKVEELDDIHFEKFKPKKKEKKRHENERDRWQKRRSDKRSFLEDEQ